jgi:hypothetical protein
LLEQPDQQQPLGGRSGFEACLVLGDESLMALAEGLQRAAGHGPSHRWQDQRPGDLWASIGNPAVLLRVIEPVGKVHP